MSKVPVSATKVDELLADVRAASSGEIGLEGFRAVRLRLGSIDFAADLADVTSRLHNNREERGQLVSLLANARYEVEQLAVATQERHSQISIIGIGGGVGLVGAAIVSLATSAVASPFSAVAVIATTGYAVFRGLLENQRLSLEIKTLNDIAELLRRHESNLREGR